MTGMPVLSDVDLRKVMEEDEGIIILNMREKSITGAGYDLTIGFIRDSDTGRIPETCPNDNNRYTLLPGHRYLVISKEFLYLSSRYMATLHSRGSYALKGLLVTSTTIDPNYAGCIAGSLFNCSSKEVYIKKNNQFATMVIHELCTSTETFIQKNEHGRPMDTQETFHGKFPNIHPRACEAGDAFYGRIRKEIEYEYEAARERMFTKAQKNKAPSIKTSLDEYIGGDIPLQGDSQEAEQADRQRKRITFLIGNGFDLNIGLDTRYRDFYDFYIKKHEHDDDMLAKEIKENIENWSDLELELGKFTRKVLPGYEEDFWDSEETLENDLAFYLEEQMKRVSLKGERKRRDIAYKMQNSLTKFHETLSEILRNQIVRIFFDTNAPIEYSFISFNYTDALDQYLRTATERFLIHLFPGEGEEVLHIHGTLTDDMVLGVDNEEQIANREFSSNAANKQRLIKEEINRICGNTRIEKACDIIAGSSIICIYGMSIGKTDKMWWQCIAKWLQGDDSRKLIIFARDSERSGNRKYSNICKDKMKKKFRDNIKMIYEWEQIKDQIYVEVNANIFDFGSL